MKKLTIIACLNGWFSNGAVADASKANGWYLLTEDGKLFDEVAYQTPVKAQKAADEAEQDELKMELEGRMCIEIGRAIYAINKLVPADKRTPALICEILDSAVERYTTDPAAIVDAMEG